MQKVVFGVISVPACSVPDGWKNTVRSPWRLNPPWTLQPHDAVEAAERQKEFFKSVNSFQRDDVDTSYRKPKETELEKHIKKTVATLPPTYHTLQLS